MKKTKRFAAMIAALTMTACAGTMNLSAKAGSGYLDIEDISLNPTNGAETKDTTIHNGKIPTPGFEPVGADEDGNLFYQSTIGGGGKITEQADAYLNLQVEVEGGDPDGPASAETAKVLSEDVWCIEITAPDCTWHVTNVARQRYHIVRWNPNAQMYGIYLHEVQAPYDASGETYLTKADYIDEGGIWGTDDTIKTATFLNRSNFQVKLTAKVLNDGGDVTTDSMSGQPTIMEGNNDGFQIKFRTKTDANDYGWDLFEDTLVLNRPYTSYNSHDDMDENYYNVLDENETQKGYLDMRLNPKAHFLENSANRTKTVLITFSKPSQSELIPGYSLYAPLQSTPYIVGYDNLGGEVTGSATAEQIAAIAQNISVVGGDTVQNSHFEPFVVSDATFAEHKAAWEAKMAAEAAAANNTDDPANPGGDEQQQP